MSIHAHVHAHVSYCELRITHTSAHAPRASRQGARRRRAHPARPGGRPLAAAPRGNAAAAPRGLAAARLRGLGRGLGGEQDARDRRRHLRDGRVEPREARGRRRHPAVARDRAHGRRRAQHKPAARPVGSRVRGRRAAAVAHLRAASRYSCTSGDTHEVFLSGVCGHVTCREVALAGHGAVLTMHCFFIADARWSVGGAEVLHEVRKLDTHFHCKCNSNP